MVSVRMCLSCRQIDDKTNLVKTYCKQSDTFAYDHYSCLLEVWVPKVPL